MPVLMLLFMFMFPTFAADKKVANSKGNDDEEVLSLDEEIDAIVLDSSYTSLKKKKWGLNFSHAVNAKAAVGSRAVLSNSLSGRYKYSEMLSFSVATAYRLPLGYVSDTSPYGLTDTSLTAFFPLNLPTFFLAKKWRGGMGVSLPTSYQARRAGKWFSLFGRANHAIAKAENYSFTGSHILYAGFARYISDISGFYPNSFLSSIHSIYFIYKHKRVSFTALGRLYLSLSLKREDLSLWQRIRLLGGQGFSFTLSYTHPQPDVSIFGQTGVNVPFISPVLTGSPLTNQYWFYLIGVGWKL